jgi:hypothetical protein
MIYLLVVKLIPEGTCFDSNCWITEGGGGGGGGGVGGGGESVIINYTTYNPLNHNVYFFNLFNDFHIFIINILFYHKH